jgi:hypothetical protein
MSVDENKEIVRRWNEEIVFGGNTDAYDEMIDEDYTMYGGPGSPWSSQIRGLEQLKARSKDWSREHPNWQVSVNDIVGEGDMVAVRMTILIEGKPASNHMSFYRLSDGKIVEDWFCSTELET